MRKILFLSLILFNIINYFEAQLPYSWTPGVNPGWVSTNFGFGGALNWNGTCLGGVVTTNCTGNYANNQNTYYTSPVINATCSNASSIIVSFNISGNAEYGYDFLFCEYSNNGGATWINFYGPGMGLTGNAGPFPGILWTLPTVPTSPNFRFRFRFTSDPIIVSEGYKITNFSIICNTVLPIELISFNATNIDNYNLIEWSTAIEINNDYYTIERSTDGNFWEIIATIDGAKNSNQILNYSIKDYLFKIDSYNYYRLKQTDFNGESKYYKLTYVDNRNNKNPKLIKIINQFGQEVNQYYKGFIIECYDDGTIKKSIRE